VRVFGEPVGAAARRGLVGYLPQRAHLGIEAPATVREIVSAGRVTRRHLFGLLSTDDRRTVEAAIVRVGLDAQADEPVNTLSGGQQQRAFIAKAIAAEPRLLILDEPTAGVDIEIRRSMWAFLRETNAWGTTIILTTHYLEEAESLCRHIAIIDGGRIIEHDTMSGVIRKLSQETFVLNFRAPVDAPPQLPGYASRMTDDHTIEVEVRKEQGLNGIFTQLGQQGVEVVSMRNKVNRLEELFMRLVERKDRAGADAG
jgi:ABC-2 type transport system ATP-binding protein